MCDVVNDLARIFTYTSSLSPVVVSVAVLSLYLPDAGVGSMSTSEVPFL